HDERTAVAKFALKKVNKRIPVILGAGSNNTYTSIEYALEAQELGADAVLVVTPYYNKATQNGIYEHYKAINNSIDIPIILYNVPGRTGLNMLPSTVQKLCTLSNIAAVKEAGGSITQMMEIKHLCGEEIDLYSGDDGLIYPCLAVGGAGVISVASNIIPKYISDLTNSFFQGDFIKARDMQFEIHDLIDALFCEVNPIPVKTAAYLMGLINSDYMRLPMTKMEKAAVLRKAMEELKLKIVR
ncbi:4-hydroxy-tetrahydrodipicolinate synthase, partial [bacterium]|nr:4-hydroxy-tetrahydrodipicolinate synthase [bacterium]